MNNRNFIRRFAAFSIAMGCVHFVLKTLFTVQYGQSLTGLLPDYIAVALLLWAGVSVREQGAIAIDRSGELNLSDAPLTSILVGPVSTSDGTWPSFARGLSASLPADLHASTLAVTDEVNGFTIFDISKERVTATLYSCGGYDSKSADDGSVKRTIELDLS